MQFCLNAKVIACPLKVSRLIKALCQKPYADAVLSNYPGSQLSLLNPPKIYFVSGRTTVWLLMRIDHSIFSAGCPDIGIGRLASKSTVQDIGANYKLPIDSVNLLKNLTG